MKRYYNSTTQEWYTEGTSMTRKIEGGVFSGVEQLESWGFEEWVEPTPTPEELLARAKANKIAELEAYNKSDAVDSFTINGKTMWLDHDVRQQLRISLDALSQAGRENVTKWFDGQAYAFPTVVWFQMLTAVEVYASDALNVTEGHRAAIESLLTVEEVEDYDFTTGYPSRLVF